MFRFNKIFNKIRNKLIKTSAEKELSSEELAELEKLDLEEDSLLLE
jgi:hypothetical protein